MAKGKTKPKVPAARVVIPQNDAEAEQFIARYGALELDFEAAKAKHVEIIAEHGRKIAELNEAFSTVEARHKAECAALHEGLCTFASANRDRLTSGGRTKTVQFATGKFYWKQNPSSIAWGKLKNGEVVDRIEARLAEITMAIRAQATRKIKEALSAELRIVESFIQLAKKPSKEAMGDSPEVATKIPGIVLVAPEEGFFVEPLASQIREVA